MSNECSVSAHLHLRPEVTTKQVKKAMSKFFREKDLSFDDVDEYKPGENISIDFTVYGHGGHFDEDVDGLAKAFGPLVSKPGVIVFVDTEMSPTNGDNELLYCVGATEEDRSVARAEHAVEAMKQFLPSEFHAEAQGFLGLLETLIRTKPSGFAKINRFDKDRKPAYRTNIRAGVESDYSIGPTVVKSLLGIVGTSPWPSLVECGRISDADTTGWNSYFLLGNSNEEESLQIVGAAFDEDGKDAPDDLVQRLVSEGVCTGLSGYYPRADRYGTPSWDEAAGAMGFAGNFGFAAPRSSADFTVDARDSGDDSMPMVWLEIKAPF